jgi:hypothetical protein
MILLILLTILAFSHATSQYDGCRWHDIHSKFHDSQFRHSSNIKVITSTILESVALVLLKEGIYEELQW